MLSVHWATFEKPLGHMHSNIIVYSIVVNNY